MQAVALWQAASAESKKVMRVCDTGCVDLVTHRHSPATSACRVVISAADFVCNAIYAAIMRQSRPVGTTAAHPVPRVLSMQNLSKSIRQLTWLNFSQSLLTILIWQQTYACCSTAEAQVCAAQASSQALATEPHPIPWFGRLLGFAVVPPDDSPPGGTARGPALVTLSEGCQMMVFDLETMHPIPLALPFQGLSTVTVSAIRSPVKNLSEDQHSVTINRLRVGRSSSISASHCGASILLLP